MSWTDEQARERVARVEALLTGLDGPALEAAGAIVDVYGEALRRIVAVVGAEPLAGDELVEHLLMVHDLHPRAVEARVAAALEEVRPYLHSHGGGVELVAVEGPTVRLRLEGHCDGCPSSAATLRLAVEDAIRDAAPEIERVEAEGAVAEEPAASGVLPMATAGPAAAAAGGGGLPMAGGAAPGAVARPAWSVAGALSELRAGEAVLRPVGGEDVLFVRRDGDVYAYGPVCPGCGASLGRAALEGAELACAACGRRYDVAAAGRCLDDAAVHLEPLPLLVGDGGAIRVAQAVAG